MFYKFLDPTTYLVEELLQTGSKITIKDQKTSTDAQFVNLYKKVITLCTLYVKTLHSLGLTCQPDLISIYIRHSYIQIVTIIQKTQSGTRDSILENLSHTLLDNLLAFSSCFKSRSSTLFYKLKVVEFFSKQLSIEYEDNLRYKRTIKSKKKKGKTSMGVTGLSLVLPKL